MLSTPIRPINIIAIAVHIEPNAQVVRPSVNFNVLRAPESMRQRLDAALSKVAEQEKSEWPGAAKACIVALGMAMHVMVHPGSATVLYSPYTHTKSYLTLACVCLG